MYKPFLYSKIQKFISYFLIFAILFLNSFHIPVFFKLQAEEIINYNLISIIVDEDTYSNLSGKIVRYSQDIQKKLSNTKIVIFQVPKDILPYKISLLNEKLFYEGDGNGLSQLIGTILIGKVPLPVVHKNNKTFLSIYPYVDFNEKHFVYNIEKGIYEATKNSITDTNVEIWHSVISPNTGDESQDIQKLNSFFDKDHDFYIKSRVFQSSLQDPYVFYYDGKREELATSLVNWKGYQLYLQNVEDLAYNRFNKHWATKLQKLFDGFQNNDIASVLTGNDEMTKGVKDILNQYGNTSLELDKIPDLHTKEIILNIAKQFFQVFNDKHIGDILKFIYNTGRYGEAGSNIRLNAPNTLISKKDLIAKNTIKDTNTLLEDRIDHLVSGGLSRNMAILTSYSYSINQSSGSGTTSSSGNTYEYKNYFFGKEANLISSASECNITRGGVSAGSVLVEANRGYNVLNAENDIKILQEDLPLSQCLPSANVIHVNTFWGGNSPANIDISNIAESGLKLKYTNYNNFVRPIFDIGGSKELKKDSELKVNSPLDCFNNNLILQPYIHKITSSNEYGNIIENTTHWPEEKGGLSYSCLTNLTGSTITNNEKLKNIIELSHSGCFMKTINVGDKRFINYRNCVNNNITGSGLNIGSNDSSSTCTNSPANNAIISGYCVGDCHKCITNFHNYNFKLIPSHITHKSPTDEELGIQYMNMTTPSLPVDRDRYVDFISAAGNYKKIEYPNLFRIRIQEGKDLNYENVHKKIKEVLDQKSKEINDIIKSEIPNGGDEIYDILKRGSYPAPSINLYETISSDQKALDMIIKNVLWNNYNSATIKYKYIFEHYLDIDGNTKSIDPSHKSDYEISYLGGDGDYANMYINIDPDKKGELNKDITNILNKNQVLNNLINGSKIASSNKNNKPGKAAKCGPPEGVPIFEWIPAIFCWLGTLVPPIAIQEGKCSSNSLLSLDGDKDNDNNITGQKYLQDTSKNGVIDGAELIKDGVIELTTPNKLYSYNETIPLEVTLKYQDKIIAVDSTSEIRFLIDKIIIKNESGQNSIIYNINSNDSNINDKEIINKYANFISLKIKASNGKAKYSIVSKEEDVDIVLRASIETKDKNGKVIINKSSDLLIIPIRGDKINIISKSGDNITSSFIAGDENKIFLELNKQDKNFNVLENQLPYILNIYDDISKEKISGPYTINNNTYSFTDVGILNKVGIYKFELKDKSGLTGYKTITILPTNLSEIKITPSSTQVVKGNEFTVFIELLDFFKNYTKQDLYKIKGIISDGGLFTSNNSQNIEMSLLDGFAYFNIKTLKTGKLAIKFHALNTNIESQILNVEVVDKAKINVNIEQKDNIIVGKEKHKINIDILDQNGNLLNDFSGVANFEIPSIHGIIEPNFVKIINGKNAEDVYLIPNFVAGQNIKLGVIVPGINDITGNLVDILPDVPIKVGLISNKPKLEAKLGEKTNIKATMYDRYGNVTFNDSNHSVKFEILDEYKKYINFKDDTYSISLSLNKGVSSTEIFTSDIPGFAFVKGEVSPSLANNTFTHTDDSGNSITVSGISENILNLETYYLFNKEKLNNINYNSLYTILLGSNYGDITKSSYLGGEILFNPGSRSLAVSSVLNNIYAKDIAFGVTPGGKILSGNQKDDASFDLDHEIISNEHGIQINFFDNIYKDFISKLWFNFDSQNTNLVNCASNEDVNFSDCEISPNKTNIILKGLKTDNAVYEAILKDNSLVLQFNSYDVFSINSLGQITKDPSINLRLEEDSIGNLTGIHIYSNKQIIGYLGIKFNSDLIGVYNSSLFPSILTHKKNQILLESSSNSYSYDYNYLGNSSFGSKGIYFFKTNSEAAFVDKDMVFNNSKLGFENYIEEAGIGWQGQNKILLEFAGGNNVGDSTKFHQTYSMINLGDPIISLEKRPGSGFDFDKTIGKKIAEQKQDIIETYRKINFNGDSFDDIAIFYDSGKVELLANYEGNFKNMGYLVYISDAGKERKGVGDFNGDSFDDIVMVDQKGKLILLQNNDGKFIRFDIHDKIGLIGGIQQLEVFDMDRDGKDDIVTVDDSGELNILYGAGEKNNIYFERKLVDNSLGLKISKEPLDSGGAIFFDGLEQLGQPSELQKKYYEESLKLNETVDNEEKDIGSENYEKLVNNLIYYQFQYSTPKESYSQEEKKSAILNSVGTDDSGNPDNALSQKIYDLQNEIVSLNTSGMTDIGNFNTTSLDQFKTFIRSEYANNKGLKIEKRYIGKDDNSLKSGDKIKISLDITNTTSKKINNIIYLDSNKNIFSKEDIMYFTFTQNNKTTTKQLKELVDGDFEYIFEDFSLNPGEKINISYELTIPLVAFGKITVGLLDSSDPYGEIALNPNNECNATQTIWKNIHVNKRTYSRFTKEFVDNSEIPEELRKNTIDENNNGIPDYIDELNNVSDKLNNNLSLDELNNISIPIKTYSNAQLQKYNIDTNNNGIPDREDISGSKLLSFDPSSLNVSSAGLNNINIGAIESQMDDIIKGLGCGFGGGSCISMPLNWAPLAPGSSPTIFGFPLTPNLMQPSAGLPAFSMLTWSIGPYCFPIPSVWPGSPLSMPPCSGILGAGGMLGATSVTNQFRIYVTPTITGAVGVALCFGGPSMSMGMIPPQAVSPLVPGGNCIVAAKPLIGCSDDGSDGDPGSLGTIPYSNFAGGNGGGNSFINANSCNKNVTKPNISSETKSNIEYYIKGNKSVAKNILKDVAVQHGSLNPNAGPLLSIGGQESGEGGGSLDIGIDTSALANFDFGNIVKINFKRVMSFPDFIMDWVSRQIEEIVTKLTALPTLYIILPDFSGFLDSGWDGFTKKLEDAFDSGNKDSKLADNLKSKANIKQDPVDSKGDKVDKTITNVANKAKGSVSNLKDSYNNFIEGNKNEITSVGNTVSGLKAAYQFLSNLPLIQFKNETVDVNIPWISFEDLDKWIVTAKMTAKQWKSEIERAKKEWAKLGDPGKLANERVSINAEEAIASIENAINSLEEFKKFPEKFLKFLTWKEKYMSEIICNVEIISEMIGGWIYDNGKRFKSWVELIILIKAILRSWQLLIDIFVDYKASCEPCKNERTDLLHFIFKLISAVIPQIPIIQFPKWPDIFFDLHNIRAGIKILMPDFKLNVVPIVLPNLPQLHLPDIPSVNITLPSIPALPKLPDLPDLPDIPSLPSIKLPDLPPPPTIPKLFGFVQVFLNILKLIFKVLCILRKSPFVPEWRAGDQIAFITERTGTLPLDFLSINFPQLSYPFVDAIKVASYVNLEFEVEFILELAKSIVEPFNRFSNNIANMGKLISFPNIDLSEIIPQEIDINASKEGVKIDLDSPQGFNYKNNINVFSYVLVRDILKLISYINENKSNEVNIHDFKKLLNSDIKNLAFSKDPREKAVFSELDKAIKYTGSKEDKFIQELAINSKNKFNIVKNYLNLEKQSTQLQISELQNIIKEGKSIQDFKLLSKFKNQNIQINSIYDNNNETKKVLLNQLEEENNKILKSFDNEYNYESEIDTLKTNLITDINSGLSSFSKEMNSNNSFSELAYFDTNKLLANNTSVNNNTSQTNNNSNSSMYSYNYEGIYMRNNVGNTTRLFNYIDEVDKKDIIIELDYDKDGDIDVIYKMGDALYLKENLKNNPSIKSFNAIKQYNISDINDILGINNSIIDTSGAPNYFKESFIPSSNFINFSFTPANTIQDNKFRFEYYDYINRFDKINAGEIPKNISPETQINYIDLISDLNLETITEISTGFVIRNNIATFDGGIGEGFIKQNEFKILETGSGILIQPGKIIYADHAGTDIKYKTNDQTEFSILRLPPNSNLEFNDATEIVVLKGKIYLFYDYIKKSNLDLNTLKGIPVLPGTYVETLNKNAYFKIKYFDESEFRSDSLATYEYYSLGQKNDNYNVSLNRQNNFYYGKLYSFGNDKKGTITSISLLSPQFQADKEPPLISLAKSIKIPVYQKYFINLQQYIADISQIKEVYVDGDLSFDSDGDGVLDNDKDSLNNSNIYNIKKGTTIYDLEFGPFDSIFKKKIKLFAVDENDNIGEFLLDLEIYAPIPQIKSIIGSTIGGIINEELANEPIDIFRLRNGLLERIAGNVTNSGITNKEGNFIYDLDSKKGIEIKNNSGAIIGKINENTGKIDLLDNKLIINITPAGTINKTKIEILDYQTKEIIFYQSLNLISNNIIEELDNFNDISTNGIYIKLNNDNFTFTKNTLSSPVLPNGGFITNDLHKAIIGISIDGNVYVLDNDYMLEYDTFGDYIIYKVKNNLGSTIGEILFKINAEYIL